VHDSLQRDQCRFVEFATHLSEFLRTAQEANHREDNQKFQKDNHSEQRSYDRVEPTSTGFARNRGQAKIGVGRHAVSVTLTEFVSLDVAEREGTSVDQYCPVRLAGQ